MKNWDRSYRICAGPPGGIGFTIGQGDDEPLRVCFDLERTEKSAQNTGSIKIWNLSPTHMKALCENDCVVSLNAGYSNSMPLVFCGVVTNVSTELDSADTVTEIELVDSRVAIRDTYVSMSYAGAVSTQKIIEDAAAQMGLPITFSYNAQFAELPNGFSYVGQAKNALNKACDCCNLTWSIQNGIIHVKKPGDTMLREVFVLSPETGLVGIPKRINLSKKDGTKSGLSGWDVVYLMNAAIDIDDYVKIESKYVSGYFRVSKIKIEGDTHSGDWVCCAQLLEVL